MTRLTEVLLKQVSNRNQDKHIKKVSNYLKNGSANTRVATTQYLKNSVLDRKARMTTGGMCLGDMQVLLDCMKLNEFQENTCVQEMTKYQACVAKEKSLQSELNAIKASDELGVDGRLNQKQANKLLRMFPHPKPQFYFTHAHGKPLRKPEFIQYNKDDAPYIPEHIYRNKVDG